MLNVIFLIAAVVGGTVMVCQFVLTLMGMGDDGGFEGHDAAAGFDGGDVGGDAAGDFHGAGEHHTSAATAADGEFVHHDSSWLFGVLSFRTLITGAAFFGVAGRAAKASDVANGPALMIALGAGLVAMYGMYWLMRTISSLTSSGNQRISSALGRRGTVYIPIPADRQGVGKVQLSMQNRIVELRAVTDEPDRLKTGETVEVVAITDSDQVRVRRVAQVVEA
jgi:membrane protein implicated in regulation of membrane protease activity